jgi:hypothetical protein
MMVAPSDEETTGRATPVCCDDVAAAGVNRDAKSGGVASGLLLVIIADCCG